jgi:hypothetical protein
MQADALTHPEGGDPFAYPFDQAGNLVTQGHGQGAHGRPTGTIVSIGVTDAGSSNAYQDVAFTHHGHRDVLRLKGSIHRDHADGFHAVG